MQQINFFTSNSVEEFKSVVDTATVKVESIGSDITKPIIARVNTVFETLEFKKYISEFSDDIKHLIQKKGIHLIRAAAGGGKTYSIATICKQLSKTNTDTVYIIACPNRIQNIQNRGYTIHSLVGKEDVPENARVISMVYDKADSIIDKFINKGKKVVLIIDEAHQLISSKIFRRRAIQMVNSLADKCETVIHMTATSRKLSHIYNYSQVMTFESVEDISNIEDFEIIKAEDLHATLIDEIKKYKSNGVIPLVHLNDIEGLKSHENLLLDKGYNVGLITSNHKNESLFLTIADKGTIPKDYDVILTTSVLEVGTNIYNTNIIPIKVVNNANHFDIDATIQFFARPRNLIDKAIMIIPSIKEKESFSFKNINYIKNRLYSSLNKAMNFTKTLYKEALKSEDYTCSEINEIFKHMLKANQSDDKSLGQGILKVDEESNEIFLDEQLLVEKAHNDYDRQLLIYTDILLKELKGHIKCRKISISSSAQSNTEDSKRIKELIFESKEEASEVAKEIILSLSEKYQMEFIEYLNNPDLLEDFFKGDLRENLLFLEQEHKQLKKITDVHRSGLAFDIIIDLFKNDKCLKTNIRAFSYVERNNIFELGYMKKLIARDEYSVIRKHLDRVLKSTKARKVSDQVIVEIANDMYSIGKMKSIYEKLLKADKEYNEIYEIFKNKSRSASNRAILEKAKENRKKQFSKLKGKLLKEIALIYNTTHIEDKNILNSLKNSYNPI